MKLPIIVAWPPRPAVAAALLVLGLVLVCAGQQLLGGFELPTSALLAYAAGLAILVVLDRVAEASREVSPSPWPPAPPGTVPAERAPRARWWLLGGAAVLGWLIWLQMRGKPPWGYSGIALLWLLAMAALLLAATWPLPPWRQWPARLGTAVARARLDWLLAGAVGFGALLLRVVALEQFPYVFGGDEGSHAMGAVEVLEGTLTHPFSTGWYSVPTLFFYLQAASIRVFGDSVAGVRMLSALIGTLAVLFTYLLARRLFDRPTAVVAAALLAAFHFHVAFSRLAANQIGDSLFVVATLYFLDRGFAERRRLDCLLAGVAVGLSQYFYFGGRLLPLLTLAYLLFVFVLDRRAEGSGAPRASWRTRAGLAAWVIGGAVLTALPLLAYYVDKPEDFTSRLNQVSIFASGWLRDQQVATGKSAVELVVAQVLGVALLPFHTTPGGWYGSGGERPFVGFPLAVLAAIGIAVISLGVLRRQYFGIAAAYWGAVVGVGLTDEPATQRFVIAAPLIALVAAVALRALARILAELVHVRPAIAYAAVAVVVVGVVAWNVEHFFLKPITHRLYGDANGLVATELGYHLRSLGPGYDVYFHGIPRMTYHGFATLPFIARGARGRDVWEPPDGDSLPPVLNGPTVFVFLPERLADLARVREWFPAGSVREFRVPNALPGSLPLFVVYEVERP